MTEGTELGHYRIIRRLGAGGMGEVFLAEDTRLGRKVALKVLPSEFAADPTRLRRFEKESRSASALSHPSVAHIYDVEPPRRGERIRVTAHPGGLA